MGIPREEESPSESYRDQSQEVQDSSAATGTTLISPKSPESQSVDLTNKRMGNRYLRDVHPVLTLYCPEQDRILDIHLSINYSRG